MKAMKLESQLRVCWDLYFMVKDSNEQSEMKWVIRQYENKISTLKTLLEMGYFRFYSSKVFDFFRYFNARRKNYKRVKKTAELLNDRISRMAQTAEQKMLDEFVKKLKEDKNEQTTR